jgi:pimeloyl-ACP methyl ester carboxylesterase
MPDLYDERTLWAKRRMLWLGVALILAGGLLAHCIQTSGGIRILDVRFAGTGAVGMSALLYVPPNATAKTPAPGVLAVHGYFNSREAQDGFAIELARRGYVVLALDQRGHGYSAPPVSADGFGAPDGLKFLRGLDIVDPHNIGLEGHSMGGWAVGNAAAAFPTGYESMVLEGSSTGAPFAPAGTSTFPRNLAVVFSRFDEFSAIMWGVPTAREVTQSPKLRTLFGTNTPVEPGRLYGSIEAGTARILFTPGITHPMDHISTVAIAHCLNWFGRTLRGGTPRPDDEQIWYWKEIGTCIALVGLVLLLLGVFDLLLDLPYFAPLRSGVSGSGTGHNRDTRWWIAFMGGTLIPVLTLLPFFELGNHVFPPSRWFPQSFTNEIATWAVLNGLIFHALSFLPGGSTPQIKSDRVRSIVIALLTVASAYVASAVVDFLFKIDFRIWFIALKLMSPGQATAFPAYLILFTIYFVLALRSLHANLQIQSDSVAAQYLSNGAAMTAGLILFLTLEYGWLFSTDRLPTLFRFDALRIIIAIQFVPVLATVAIISTFTFRRTRSHLPGALICALLITWYIVAGQATHIPS